ncbi:XAC2610-related protein [Flavobacterium sp. '19STA2R22 D10 B1']|uniref:XAC2610-related protein n=1 Tax=Flavobacterium aerium TaxID=3037261 RepID=UPI00278C43E1|nr:hypothetical protein [Flavobacterium sp. '19STA2R22 D10 B1']
MKTILSIYLLLTIGIVSAQSVYKVDNFAKEYYGKIYINDSSEVFSPGWVAIYDRKTNKELIKVESEELALSLHNGKALANINELPYGEQSLIMYNDYNFDGINDFSIQDGQNSCYHGPSFQIFLGTKKGFQYSDAFTQLAQENCGMFYSDPKTKTIQTMTKSGCCWHQYVEYTVQNNKPFAIKIIEEAATAQLPFFAISEQTWNGKKMVTKTKEVLYRDDLTPIVSFMIEDKDKEVLLFKIDEGLIYAVLQKDNQVEFSYPIRTVESDQNFEYSKTANTLSFQTKEAKYIIYQNSDRIGIDVIVKDKTHHWIGVPSSVTGSLKYIVDQKWENVILK